MLKMAEEDETAPMKKPRSQAQIQSLEKARAKARELRTQRNVIREKHGITDETDATPDEKPNDETPNDDSETENTETESDEEQPPPAVVEKKEKPVKKEKSKTDPAPKPKPKPQAKPQQRDEHVPVPQNNFRMMSRNQYILFDE